ncbi:MAG: glycerate kinase [Candidatus Solibacter usitatus]|nr:glycerate kinase [Candidatus Solibacter usitatus]
MTLRKQALAIFRAALKAADPAEAVLRHVRVGGGKLEAGGRRYRLDQFRNTWVIGAGKASAAMAVAVEKLLGRRVSGGLINVKHGHVARLRRIELNECGHPVPDSNGVAGALRIAEIAARAGEQDLVVCLISGGASALLPYPAPPVALEEKQATTRLLLASGANIHEMNAVRKHISAIKGGQLARLAAPATVIALMLSDVIGDNLDVIGSGPTAPDESTFAVADAILRKYGIRERIPGTVGERIERGMRGETAETPKPGDAVFERVQNLVVGSNALAVGAAARKARELGFRTLVLSTSIEGETRDVARMHAAIAREAAMSGQPVRPPACILSGGETTVTLRGGGLGGRNQEFALAAAIDIAGLRDVVVFSGGTDGSDGPTDAAGAIADGDTLARGPDAAQYLANNDSYHFFERLGDLVKTGPTNTNVMDVRIVLVGGAR